MAAESNARLLDDSDITIDRMDLAGLEEFFLENEEIFNRGLTLKQAVFYYGDTRKSLKAKVEDGSIPAIRLPEDHGKKWRIFPDGVPEQFQHLIPKKLRHKDSQGEKKQKGSEQQTQTDKHIASLHVSGAVTPPVVVTPVVVPDLPEPAFPEPPLFDYPELDFELVPKEGPELIDFSPELNTSDGAVQIESAETEQTFGTDEQTFGTETEESASRPVPGEETSETEESTPYVLIEDPNIPYVELEEYTLPVVEIASPEESPITASAKVSAAESEMAEGAALEAVDEGPTPDTSQRSQIEIEGGPQVEFGSESQIDLAGESYLEIASGSQFEIADGSQSEVSDGGSLMDALSIYGADIWTTPPTDETLPICQQMAQTPGVELEIDSVVPASSVLESMQIYAGEFVESQHFDPWENFDAESPWLWDTALDREFRHTRVAFPEASAGPIAEPKMPEMPTMYFGTDLRYPGSDQIVDLPAIEHAMLQHSNATTNGFLAFSQMSLPTSPCFNTIAPASSDQLMEKIHDLDKQIEAISYRNSYLETRVVGLEDQVKFLSQANYQNRGFNKLLLLLPGIALLAIIYLFRFASLATP